MSFASNCPRCQKQVTIPFGVDRAALVRCPLCDAEYALSEALAMGPPALIVVGATVASPAAAAAAGKRYIRADRRRPATEHELSPAGAEEGHWAGGWPKVGDDQDRETVHFSEEGDAGVATEGEDEADAAIFGAITGKAPARRSGRRQRPDNAAPARRRRGNHNAGAAGPAQEETPQARVASAGHFCRLRDLRPAGHCRRRLGILLPRRATISLLGRIPAGQ